MTDLSRLLNDALPRDPAPLDLTAVAARSSQLTRRRRAAAGCAAGLVVATTAAAFAAGGQSQRMDRLGPAADPTVAASAEATPSPPAASAGPETAAGLKAPAAQRLERTDEFGSVTGMTRLADGTLQVQVNRVDWLSGNEAKAAAAADGTDAGDYYVVDDNRATRTYDISSTAKVYGSIGLTGVPELSAQTIEDWTRFLSSGSRALGGQDVAEQVGGTYFHFQVEDGLVVGIEEQYRP